MAVSSMGVASDAAVTCDKAIGRVRRRCNTCVFQNVLRTRVALKGWAVQGKGVHCCREGRGEMVRDRDIAVGQ